MTRRSWVRLRDGECRRVRPIVLAAVETQVARAGAAGLSRVAPTMGSDAADHLARCPACRAEASETALTLIRLQRWAREVPTIDDVPAPWGRLRARLEDSRRRAGEAAWRARATVAGLLTSTLIVAVVVAPMTVTGSGPGWGSAHELAGSSTRDPYIGRLEQRYVEAARQTVPSPVRTIEISAPTAQRLLPDGIRPAAKEVSPTQSASRLLGVS